MSSNKRPLSYSLAINEALHQMMSEDESVMLIGQGVKSPWYVGNTANGLIEAFGSERVIDTPVSENGITGAAVGAALVGMRPVVVHPRVDFMLYALDPIINEAANWHYMFGGKASVPLVVWAIINRGGEQAAQHSQSLHALFSHIPGLKVVMPSTPYDAKGLMISAILDENPVIYMDERWLYPMEDDVPREPYSVPIGKGKVRKKGRDCTLIATSWMVHESLKAARELAAEGIDVEVLDLLTVKPIDQALIYESVKKTGSMVIVDGGWKTCGLSAEVAALASENVFEYLERPIVRVALPDAPAPASLVLEQEYYFGAGRIARVVRQLLTNKARMSVSYDQR
jgi:pyruvate/2-oxoglutarate/acetoin dehydrogenase E1 component